MKTILSLILSLILAATLPLSVLAQSQTNTQLNGNITSQKSGICIDITKDLRFQTRDSQITKEISALQGFLQANNYMTASPTGYFGLLTVAAVKKFQIVNGISATGFVGPLTRAKIKAVSCSTNNDVKTSGNGNSNLVSSVCSAGAIFNSQTGARCASVPVQTPQTLTQTIQPAQVMTITGITPNHGKGGETVTITGNGFTSDTVVNFYYSNPSKDSGAGQTKQIVSVTSNELKFFLDPRQVANSLLGVHLIILSNSKGISNSVNFTFDPGTYSTQTPITPTPTPTPTPTNTSPVSNADIIISDMTWDPASLTQSYDPAVKFNYTVKNIGSETANIQGFYCFMERPNDVHPAISTTLGGPCLSNSPGGNLAAGESKTYEGVISDISYRYRTNSGPLYVRFEFSPNYSMAESNRNNNYIDKTMTIIPAPNIVATIVNPTEGQVFPLNTVNTGNSYNQKGEYYAPIAFKVRAVGGIEKGNYAVKWTLKNLGTGAVQTFTNADTPTWFTDGEAVLYYSFWEPGDWSITASATDSWGGATAMSGVATPVTFKITK